MGKLRIKFSPLFLILAAILVVLGEGYLLIGYVAALLLHECGHAFAASRFGYELNVISLMPYGAKIGGRIEGMSLRQEFWVAAAGPLTSFLLATLGAALWWLVPQTYLWTQSFVEANLSVALFNLLPVFPLDGGRVCLACAARGSRPGAAERVLRRVGAVIAAVFCMLFVASMFFGVNFTFIMIAVFIFSSAALTAGGGRYRILLDKSFRAEKLKEGVPVRTVAISAAARICDVLKQSDARHYVRYVLLDEDMEELCVLSEAQMEDVIVYASDYHDTVADVLNRMKRRTGGTRVVTTHKD